MQLHRIRRIMLAAALVIAGLAASMPAPALAAHQDGNAAHQHRHDGWPHGDPAVIRGLVLATADVTGLRPRAVEAELRDGQSLAAIAAARSQSADDILARFDRLIDQLMTRAVERERLPQSVAAARAAWFKQSARLQIDQPGLSPRFPGLHEVHVVLISAAVEVSGLQRETIRARLAECATLAEIVAAEGKTAADVVGAAMARFDAALQRAVDAGKLETAQRDEWRAALATAAANMTTTPGLHVAGKACAP